MAYRTLTLIFSKTRPLQLHGLLTSFFHHVSDIEDVIVLHYEVHQDYEKVAQDFPQVTFQRQRNFQLDVMRIISNPFWSHILFLVDDSVFVRPCSLLACRNLLKEHPQVLGVSLRLGNNTTQCYTLRKRQTRAASQKQGEFTMWNWMKSNGDFGYPLEVSSSVYRMPDIYYALSRCNFYNNPNVLEYRLDEFRKQDATRFPKKPLLAAYEISVCFSIPMNLTQTSWKNRASNATQYSVRALLKAFQQGKRMNSIALTGYLPVAAHEEVAFEIK